MKVTLSVSGVIDVPEDEVENLTQMDPDLAALEILREGTNQKVSVRKAKKGK